MRILLTGFEPFGGESINPSWEAVRRLDGTQVGDQAMLFATKLPVVFNEARSRLISSMHAIKPDIVIAVGQAGGRSKITPERIAINVSDARIPDNAGQTPSDQPVIPDGPAAYWSTLPVRKIVSAISEAGIPASLSNSAGTFVCNHVFYGLMHELALSGNKAIGGFIHIPYIPEQTEKKSNPYPSLSLERIVEGLKKAAFVSSEMLQMETTNQK